MVDSIPSILVFHTKYIMHPQGMNFYSLKALLMVFANLLMILLANCDLLIPRKLVFFKQLLNYMNFFSGIGTATIIRFCVFACLHCEQSLHFTRIYDETFWWTTDTNVPGIIIFDSIHFYQNFCQFIFRSFVYSASPSLEFIHEYLCTFDLDMYMYNW